MYKFIYLVILDYGYEEYTIMAAYRRLSRAKEYIRVQPDSDEYRIEKVRVYHL